MFRRRTAKVRKRRDATKVLRASVISPRIIWHEFIRSLGMVIRFALIIGLIGAAGYGIWRGVNEGLLENDKFRIQSISLNENTAIDEIQLLEITGINPEGNLFDCDPTDIQSRLLALPEIASATVKRDYPGDLIINVMVRKPEVWVSSSALGIPARDAEHGLLADYKGVLFPCPRKIYEESLDLPVIELRKKDGVVKAGETIEHPDFDRCMRLLHVAEKALPEASLWIDKITLHKSWGSELHTRDGMVAIFGHDDLERQMNDLLAAVEHARKKGDQIERISLVGKRNQPVTLKQPEPPRAIIIVEEPVTDGEEPSDEE